jgi:hypothetical protein
MVIGSILGDGGGLEAPASATPASASAMSCATASSIFAA